MGSPKVPSPHPLVAPSHRARPISRPGRQLGPRGPLRRRTSPRGLRCGLRHSSDRRALPRAPNFSPTVPPLEPRSGPCPGRPFAAAGPVMHPVVVVSPTQSQAFTRSAAKRPGVFPPGPYGGPSHPVYQSPSRRGGKSRPTGLTSGEPTSRGGGLVNDLCGKGPAKGPLPPAPTPQALSRVYHGPLRQPWFGFGSRGLYVRR